MSHDGGKPDFTTYDEADAFRVPAEPEFGRRTPGDTSVFVGPKVPAWVADPAKWRSLTRAERRQLERHHRKQQGGRGA